MKYALFVCFALAFLPSSALTAQVENIWKGGAPGQERDWDQAANWSLNRIPGEFDIAVIPDCSTRGGFYPVVWIEQPAVLGLRILSGAELYIAKGAILAVDSGDPNHAGVLIQGDLHNDGRFIVAGQNGSAHWDGQ